MSVKIITGSIGAGKTEYCTDEMAKIHAKSPQRRLIMLVPSHYTHETERMLINKFGGTGLNNIECTSFEKLSRELLCDGLPRLDAPGKNALICRSVKECLNDIKNNPDEFNSKLVRTVGRRGFTDIAQSFINEMRRYNITSEILSKHAEETESEILKEKLAVMAKIAENYTKLLSEANYTDSDDDMSRLAGVIPDSFSAADTVWIDKFDEFLPCQLEVLSALIASGADITVTFSICPDTGDTYYGTTSAINSILALTDAKIIHLDGEMTHIKNAPDLKFLFSTWHDRSVYDGEVKNAEVFISRDAYTETERTACKILDLVREDRYRFRDIGIICGDYEGYSHIIESIFNEYEIPYYSDKQIAISEYPIAMQILSLFDVIENNWNYRSMFEYLRSGFIYIKEHNKYVLLDSENIDRLEKFVLKYGIEYKSAWQRSWAKENTGIIGTAFKNENNSENEDTDSLDELRKTVIEPISAYETAAKNAETVSDYCRALFEFLENIYLYQGIKSELLSEDANHADSDSQRFAQIWNLILDILTQVNTALGNENATHQEFADYIRAAMNMCTIRTVPSGIDRVFIGSADMNRSLPTPVVFAIGAVSGTFPRPETIEGFLSNADRENLRDSGLQLAPTTSKKTDKLRNTVYKLFSAASEKLFISYPSMTPDGNANLPSQTVTDITHKLKNIKISDDIIPDEDSEILYISSPKATLHKLLTRKGSHPIWPSVMEWFTHNDKWLNILNIINKAKRHSQNSHAVLEEKIARELYCGMTQYSATRLNTYAKCPFSHYLKYGLSARETEEYVMDASDTGTYAHEIIRRFCDAIDKNPRMDWKTADDAECDKLITKIIDETVENVLTSELKGKEEAADILHRMGGAAKEAAKTALYSIKCGEFTPLDYERKISVKLSDDIELYGIIDRIDMCRHDGVNEYRIIDYKTGSKDMSASDMYYGLDMQPAIYALAIRMADKDAVISGMYYGHVRNDFAVIGATSKESTAESNLRDNTSYNGLTFVGQNTDEPIPQEEINRIENPELNGDFSLFFGSKGVTGYNKKLRTRPDSTYLTDMVRDKILSMDKEIKKGCIDTAPLDTGKYVACAYCPYSSVCRFDECNIKVRKKTAKDEEIWEMLEEDRDGLDI